MPQKTLGSPEWDTTLLARINLNSIEGKELSVLLQQPEEFLKGQGRRPPLSW
jgi:hypothetical protein